MIGLGKPPIIIRSNEEKNCIDFGTVCPPSKILMKLMPIKPSLESLCHGNVSWKYDNLSSQLHHDCSMICIATALQTYIYKIDLTFGENSKLVGKTNKIFL